MVDPRLQLLTLVTAQYGREETLVALLRDWHQQRMEHAGGPLRVVLLSEYDRPERLVVLSEWAIEDDRNVRETERRELDTTLTRVTIYEPAVYRLHPIKTLGRPDLPYEFVGASLTFAPESMAATAQQMALAEGERLMAQPGAVWARRMHSSAGPAVVVSSSGWRTRDDFQQALRAIMEPVEDRIDLLGCKQIFFSLIPVWKMG
ncbi:MAG: hypothetical protein ACR2PL_20640 [Dehalococcoidia bacterium]